MLRMLTGFCFAILYVVIESWLNEHSTNENRGAIFATYVVITLTVMAAGQMMNLLYDPMGLQLFLIASVLVSIAAVPIALSTSPAPAVPESVSIDLKRLYRISPIGAIACFGSGLATGSFWALAPVFTAGIAPDVSLAAWFMAAAVLGGAVSNWPLGTLSDRVGRRGVLGMMCLTGTVVSTLLVVGASQWSFPAVALTGAVWGMIGFPLYSIAVAHTNDFADANEYVRVSAGLLLLYGVGAIIGPLASSACMTWFGAGGLFLFIAYIYGVLVLTTFYRMLRGRKPTHEHIPFSDALAAAATASQVYEEEVQQQASMSKDN
jgi:MFS family permease